MIKRMAVSSLVVGAALLVGITKYEGFPLEAVIPVRGDVPTIGPGRTEGVKIGDKTEPVRELVYLLNNLEGKYAAAVRRCVTVPLYQHEFDAYVSLTYNIGTTAFCGSTLVRKLNAGDYTGACAEIKRWNRFQGKPLRGLTIRREAEYKQCMGQ
jgi:lysozyme